MPVTFQNLAHGAHLDKGLADRKVLFGGSAPAAVTVKTLCWRENIDEPAKLTRPMRDIVFGAVGALAREGPKSTVISRVLAMDSKR